MPNPKTFIDIGSIESSEYEKALLNLQLKALSVYARKFQEQKDRQKVAESFDRGSYIDWLTQELTSGR